MLTELAARNKSLVIRHNADGHLYESPEEAGLAATPDAIAWEAPARLDLGVEEDEIKATIQVKTTTGSWGGFPPPWVQIQAAAEAYILGAPEYCVAWYESDFRRFATFHAKWYSADAPITGLNLRYGMTISQVIIDARKRWYFGKKLEEEQGFQVGEEGTGSHRSLQEVQSGLRKGWLTGKRCCASAWKSCFNRTGNTTIQGGKRCWSGKPPPAEGLTARLSGKNPLKLGKSTGKKASQ